MAATSPNPDELFEWLDRAWTNRDSGLQNLFTEPLILRYQDDSRFASHRRKVGLPVPANASKQHAVAGSSATHD